MRINTHLDLAVLVVIMVHIYTVAGLKCYSCIDMVALETDATNSITTPQLLHDVKADLGLGQNEPAICDESSLVECPKSDDICLASHGTTSGIYGGVRAKIDAVVLECASLQTPHIKEIPDAGSCVSMERVISATSSEINGVSCACSQDGCNSKEEHIGLFCYACMGLNILESNRPANSSVTPLRTKMMDVLYDGVDPGECDNPRMDKCTSTDICFTFQSVLEGVYNGIEGKVSMMVARCVDLINDEGHSKMPANDCVRNKGTFDLDAWSVVLQSTFKTSVGVSCSCDDIGCNDPKTITDAKPCSYCKDIQADFGDVEINRQMEIEILDGYFEPNTPWCPHNPSEVICEPKGSCVTLDVTLLGNYADRSGKVDISYHHCMRSNQVMWFEWLSKTASDCQPVTRQLLEVLYGDTWIKPFSTLGRVEGSICLCKANMCNLPQFKQNELPENAGAETKTSLLSIFALFITILV